MNNYFRKFLMLISALNLILVSNGQDFKVLNFYGSNGFVHETQMDGVKMIEELGEKNSWEVVSVNDPMIFSEDKLRSFDVVIFNNNCGNKGPIMNDNQHKAMQQYIRNGGGFVGIHCAGAIWKERDATNHPGAESFDGEIARFLIFDPPLSSMELLEMRNYLLKEYGIKE